MGIEVEKALSGAKVGDAGVDAGGVAEIIDGGEISELHSLGEAAGERRQEDCWVEPKTEPITALAQCGELADDVSGTVVVRKASLELVAAGSWDENYWVEATSSCRY